MREHKNKVYLTDPDHGVYVFDIYGNYIKRIPIKGIRKLRISNDRLFYMKASEMVAFHLVDGSEQKVMLPKTLSNSYSVNRNRIVESTGEEIFIFTPKP